MLGRVRTLDEVKEKIEATSVDSVLAFVRDNPFRDFTVVTIGPRIRVSSMGVPPMSRRAILALPPLAGRP
jgi:hypothetical protein